MWDGASGRLRQLIDADGIQAVDMTSMRFVEFFGAPMPVKALRTAMQRFPNAVFQNTYGSSEAFWMSRLIVDGALPSELETLPIGTPLPCYDFSLRDPEGNPVAAGEQGEICVVGPIALAGYWERPDLTEQVRLNGVPNSFRTGDIARLGDDGLFHYVGRRDHQVKISGHRFDLGEIEAVLKSHPSVGDAVAFAAADEVFACVLANQSESLYDEIQALCTQRLPVFAIPSQVRVQQSFPQLPSGKIDRVTMQKQFDA